MLIDHLYGTTFTCYWSSSWSNFSLTSRNHFEKLLSGQSRHRYSIESNVDCVDWILDNSSNQKGCLIVLRGISVYRIFCFFSKKRVLMLTSCPPMLCAQALDCIGLAFDCMVRLLTIPGDALKHLFSVFIQGLLMRNISVEAYQMVFEVGSKGREMTLALPQYQIQRLLSEISDISSGSDDFMDRVYQSMKLSYFISFDKLRLMRVNCCGFTMTTNGKLRLYNSMNPDEIQRLISVLLTGSLTLQP